MISYRHSTFRLFANGVISSVFQGKSGEVILMSIPELILRFIAGGSIVVLVSLLAKSDHPFLSGLIVLFPAVTLVSFFFLKNSVSTESIHKISLFSIYTYPTTLCFLVAFYIYHSKYGVINGLCIAIAAWILSAVLLIFLNSRYIHIGL